MDQEKGTKRLVEADSPEARDGKLGPIGHSQATASPQICFVSLTECLFKM